jgi:hypothetical protein
MIARKPAHNGMHVPPSTWLGSLIACRCGHGIGSHSPWGCEGDFRGRCSCGCGPSQILGDAVSAAREEMASEF